MGDFLTKLEPGMAIVYGGNQVVTVPEDLAEAFADGDRLVVVQDAGDLLHIPEAAWSVATAAVDSAVQAFESMGSVGDDQITAFYTGFADRLADDDLFGLVNVANAKDVKRAHDPRSYHHPFAALCSDASGHDRRIAILGFGTGGSRQGRRDQGPRRMDVGTGSGRRRRSGVRFRGPPQCHSRRHGCVAEREHGRFPDWV